MQKQRSKFSKRITKVLWAMIAIYVVAYIANAAVGGYWMIPSRDGGVRFKPEYGGLSLTIAIMWQPRFGHFALGESDFVGVFFGPLISLDRAWIHTTHYMSDDSFDAWLKALPPSKVHPKLREEFICERSKSAV